MGLAGVTPFDPLYSLGFELLPFDHLWKSILEPHVVPQNTPCFGLTTQKQGKMGIWKWQSEPEDISVCRFDWVLGNALNHLPSKGMQ